MRLWRKSSQPNLRIGQRPNSSFALLAQPLLFYVVLLCILQGCCETNSENTLSSVYGSLVNGGTGNGGNGGNGNGDDWENGGVPSDAEYITAIIGESIVFNCHVEFPEGYPVPYIVQWDKKGVEIPIHIWYDGYPTHSGEGYEGRVARVNPNSSYGLASLNLTAIRESDRGWYNCRVYFLNRSPPPQNTKNISGSWYHLDVHAPPRFIHTSDDVVYTKIGKNIILHCRAEGTPPPEIVWYKDSDPVQPSVTISIVNEGTELRISQIKQDDIGDFTCIARNGEGKIHHVVKVLIAGSAVIITPPQNMTKVEGEKAAFPCEWRAMPSNASVVWFRDAVPVRQIASLESRLETPAEGSLIINPVAADDSGFYECRVSNGIGETQNAVAYLNIEYPAQVTYTPTVQYLPHRLAGVVRCYIMANPPIQFVMWTRDKHLLEPYETEGFAVMNNGSLLIDRVKETHQGMYTCTPYNVHGTKGSSLQMQVIVKEPPKFDITPDPMYQSKLGSSLEIPCSAVAPNGTTSPLITWQRRDGRSLSRDRLRVVDGSLMIENLHQSDYGEYECIASNEVATLVTSTKIIVEGTKPHAPYNITATCAVFTITLSWLPGYSGGPDFRQNYVVWYRPLGETKWDAIPVTPQGSTRITLRNLSPGKTYQIQVIGTNDLGEGQPSEIVNVTTKDVLDYSVVTYPINEQGEPYIPVILRPKGPKPGAPSNVTLEATENYFILISWQPPSDVDVGISHYLVMYKLPTDPEYKQLSKEPIKPPLTTFQTRVLRENLQYHIVVSAYSGAGVRKDSEVVVYQVPTRDRKRAIIAGLVGGLLFFVVAIILSVCAVKICNRRKRRKQEKAYNMVACRLTDARNGGQIPTQPQVPAKPSGVVPVLVVISWLKRAYRSVGRGVARFIIHLLDLPLRRHAIILTTRKRRPPSIASITLSLGDIAHLQRTLGPEYSTAWGGRTQGTRRHPSSPLILQHGQHEQPRDVVDESSDDGGFLAPRPLRYYPRGRRRFNLVLPGSFLPSTSLIRPEYMIPRPFASSPIPGSRSVSRSSYLSPVDLNLSSVTRFPVLVQVHQQPPYLWSTATTGRHFHPSDPTPPPWEAERIRDTLARDLDYLERQVPSFLRRAALQEAREQQQQYPPQTSPRDQSSGPEKSPSVRFQERSSSSGFQSGSKHTTSSMPSGGSLGRSGHSREILLRPIALPEEPAHVQTLYPPFPPYRTLPPRTYENWPRREIYSPPVYTTAARSPSLFETYIGEDAPLTVPTSEPSPSTRTLLDMSVDDPYEFDPVIPDTSPEIASQVPAPMTSTTSTTSMSRFKRTRDRYENMEARVAAMKEEFFEYRRRQKKRMESAC